MIEEFGNGVGNMTLFNLANIINGFMILLTKKIIPECMKF